MPRNLVPELRGLLTDRIAEDDRGPAAHQRQQCLLDRGVERAGDQERGAEGGRHVEVLAQGDDLARRGSRASIITPFGCPVEPEV